MSDGPSARPVVVIGVDACDPQLVLRWVAEGAMPWFARLLERGIRFPVVNDPGLFVGSVWPTLVTGVTPTRHRWYCYCQHRHGRYQDRKFDPQAIAAEPFWNQLGGAGKRVAIFDVPLLPVTPARIGLQLAEWGAHDTFLGGLRSWPPDLAETVRARFGIDPVGCCDDIERDIAGLRRFQNGLLERIRTRERIIEYLSAQGPWDLMFAVYSESHCVGHQLWHLHDSTHPLHDAGLSRQLGDPLKQVYQAIDASLRRLQENLFREAQLLVLLSHGMGPHYGLSFMLDDILRRFEGMGTHPATRGWEAARRLWRALPPPVRGSTAVPQSARAGLKHLLLSRGRARRRFFAVPNNDVFGAVRINLEGREPAGKVRWADFDATRTWLQEQLVALRCAVTGEPAVLEVLRTEQLYSGPFAPELPDLLVRWNQSVFMETVTSPLIGTLTRPYQGLRTGDHRANGEGLLVVGNAPQPGLGPRMRSVDVAPTVASLLGVGLEGVDGKPVAHMVSQGDRAPAAT